jgi:hypothetical protein
MSYVIPTDSTDALGFYGAAPVTRPTAAAQAAITDSTGGTAAPTTGVTAVAYQETINLDLGSMAAVADAQVYKIALPYAFTLKSVLFRAGNPITTAAKATTLTAQINGVACTGGVISVAGVYATGATQAGTAITALNVGTAGQTIEVIVSATTPFIEGSGWVGFTITNNSRANADATIIAAVNALRSGVVSVGLIKGS